MNRLSRLLFGLAAAGLVLVMLPASGRTQTVVISSFSGKPKKLAVKAQAAVVKAFGSQGATLVSYSQYQQKAKRLRIPGNRLLQAGSIKKLSKAMKLDGVVTGNVKMAGRKYRVSVTLYDGSGKVKAKKTYQLKRQNFPAGTANGLAKLMVDKLGGSAVAAAPESTESTESTESSESTESTESTESSESTETASTGSSEETSPLKAEEPEKAPPSVAKAKTGEGSFLPQWAQEDTQAAEPAKPREEEEPAVTRKAPGRRSKAVEGSVPDLLIAAGIGLDWRQGMDPKHKAGPFPVFRLEGRIFLGAFLQKDWVDGLGLGGGYNRSIALQYGPDKAAERWDSFQSQYNFEGIYRLAFNNVPLKPAIMARVGYGSTSSIISTTNTMAVSVAYSYPYGALDIYLTLYEDMVRLGASAGYLFAVSASEMRSGGSGSGFIVKAGLDLDVIKPFQLSLGYELNQFTIATPANPNATPPRLQAKDESDTYNMFFVRIGFRYH